MSNPEAAAAHAEAVHRIGQGRLQEAIERLQALSHTHPEFAPAQHDLAVLLWKSGDREGALVPMGAAHLLEPENVVTLKNLAHLCLEVGLLQEALAAAEKILSLEPGSGEAMLMKGFLIADHGDAEEGERALAAAAGQDSVRGPATEKLGEVRGRTARRTETAMTADGRNLTRGPIAAFLREAFRGLAPYDYMNVHADRIEETLLRLAPRLGAESRVLDVGSYCGELPLLLSRFLGVTRVSCCTLDLMPLQNEAGELKLPGMDTPVPVGRCDIERERWPWEDGSMDAVICLETLEHLTDHPLFMMAQANRVLAEGGLMMLTTPNAHSFYALTRILEEQSPNLLPQYSPGRPGYGHIKEYTYQEMILLFEAAGFEIAEQLTFSPFEWAPDAKLPGLKEALRPHGLWDSRSGMLHFVVGRKIAAPKFERLEPIYADTKEWERWSRAPASDLEPKDRPTCPDRATAGRASSAS